MKFILLTNPKLCGFDSSFIIPSEPPHYLICVHKNPNEFVVAEHIENAVAVVGSDNLTTFTIVGTSEGNKIPFYPDWEIRFSKLFKEVVQFYEQNVFS